MEKQTRSILAILSTDIPGYTQKTEEDESYAFSLIAKHRDIITKYVNTSNGVTFKEMGDGTYSKFDSAIDASRCAIKIQSEAIERELPLRVGLHLGDVMQDGDDVLGVGVNIADRIQSLAKTGTIYISDDVYRQIKNQSDLNSVEVGEHVLKGMQGKMTLHELIFNMDGTITEKIEVTHKIQVHDEDGKKVEKEVPRNEFLKTLRMFFFDNKTNNPDLDWLQYGITYACKYVLLQEKLLDIYKTSVTKRMKQAGYKDGVGLPNTLKKKITNITNKDYWLSGSLLNHENGYNIITELYDSKFGKLIKQREFIGDNLITLIDNIALQLRYDLDIPVSHIESTDNLPFSDIYTNNMKAWEYYTRGGIEYIHCTNMEDGIMRAIEHYNKALEHDKNFAIVYRNLSRCHFLTNNDKKCHQYLEKAMSFLYKFPESIQYEVKQDYFRFVEKDPGKIIKLYELWTKLKPHDIEAHKELAEAYGVARELDKALAELLIVFNMQPSNFNILSDIVEICIAQKKFEIAEKFLKEYINNFSDNYRPYYCLGNMYEEMAEFDKAKEQYEIAALIEPKMHSIALRLSSIETKFGNFDLAIKKLIALGNSEYNTRYEKYCSYQKLYGIYEIIGQLKESIKFANKANELDPT